MGILQLRSSILNPLSSILTLVLVCGFLFFFRLGARDLTSSHEARAAQDAQTILSTGDWGLPRLFDGKLELQKPPLYYWLVALIARVRGGPVDAWTVRLPAAVSGLATVLLLYLVGAKVGRPAMGCVAAVILATSFHFTWLARVGRIDMPLTLTVTVALVGFYMGRQSAPRSWRWFFGAYLAVALGVLLKGPIAAVLPAVVAASYLGAERQSTGENLFAGISLLRFAHRWGLWWGIPLVLAVASPWFVWANAKTHGELFRVFFWHHNVERGLGGSAALQAHPWWFYAARLAFDLLPWSILLPLAGWFLWRRGAWQTDPLARFGVVWLLGIFLLLSCMRFKRADYLVPAYPGAALLLGCVAECWWRGQRFSREPGASARPRLAAKRLALAVCGFAIAGCVAAWWIYLERILPAQETERAYRRFAAEIRRRTPLIVLFFRAEAHHLAFHVAPPMTSVLEWENLDWWVGQPAALYVVMPPDCAAEWPQHLTRGRLEEVLRSTDLGPGRGERPFVLLRTHAGPPGADATAGAPSRRQHSRRPRPAAATPIDYGGPADAWCWFSLGATCRCPTPANVPRLPMLP
jgi:4-amino-4-deoxy-L-arabinose transferase-like glycosyltransferase